MLGYSGVNIMTEMEMLCVKARNGDISAQRTIEKAIGEPEGTYSRMYNVFLDNKEYALQGDVKAMVMLGQNYQLGFITERDIDLAEYWYKMAAEKNDQYAIYCLGALYVQCFDERDDAAEQLIKKALSMGLIPNTTPEDVKTVLKTAQRFKKDKPVYIEQVEQENVKQITISLPRSKAASVFINHVQSRGTDLYNNKQMLSNIISDIFVNDEKLRNAMKIAIADGVSIQIASLLSFNDNEQMLGRLRIINSFAERFGMSISLVTEAVNILALGIGLNIE
jgi:hypothetical protein